MFNRFTSCLSSTGSCLSSGAGYVVTGFTYTRDGVKYVREKTGLKHLVTAATIVAVPLCYAGNTLFKAGSFFKYLYATSSTASAMSILSAHPVAFGIAGTLTAGTWVFGCAVRPLPIIEYFFPPKKPSTVPVSQTVIPAKREEIANHLTETRLLTPKLIALVGDYIEKTVPKTTENTIPAELKSEGPSCIRRTSSWLLYAFLNTCSTAQMLVNDLSTYLGLLDMLAFLPGTSEVYVALTLLTLFNFNYAAYNLEAAYSNARKFRDAINLGQYDVNTCKLLLTMLVMIPSFFSIPTNGYFTVQSGLPQIEFLKNLFKGMINEVSFIAAAINLISAFPMSIPSIYEALTEGIRVPIPHRHSECLSKLTCGAVENKLVLLRNGIILPSGLTDNIANALFSAASFAYTLQDMFSGLDPKSKTAIAVCSFVGLSNGINSFAFMTLRSLRRIIARSLETHESFTPRPVVDSGESKPAFTTVEADHIPAESDPLQTPLLQPPRLTIRVDSVVVSQAHAKDHHSNEQYAPLHGIRVDSAGTSRNNLWNERKTRGIPAIHVQQTNAAQKSICLVM